MKEKDKIIKIEAKIAAQYRLLSEVKTDKEWWEITSQINSLSVDLSNARKQAIATRSKQTESLPTYSLLHADY